MHRSCNKPHCPNYIPVTLACMQGMPRSLVHQRLVSFFIRVVALLSSYNSDRGTHRQLHTCTTTPHPVQSAYSWMIESTYTAAVCTIDASAMSLRVCARICTCVRMRCMCIGECAHASIRRCARRSRRQKAGISTCRGPSAPIAPHSQHCRDPVPRASERGTGGGQGTETNAAALPVLLCPTSFERSRSVGGPLRRAVRLPAVHTRTS